MMLKWILRIRARRLVKSLPPDGETPTGRLARIDNVLRRLMNSESTIRTDYDEIAHHLSGKINSNRIDIEKNSYRIGQLEVEIRRLKRLTRRRKKRRWQL